MAQIVSRLALLMQVLGVTGYDVAMALNIDPSLISKWKRNRRRVPGRTDTMRKIAAYLLVADERLGSRTVLPMLENIAGNSFVDRHQAVDLLTQWLLDPEPPSWFSDDTNISNINLKQNSYNCTIEVFNGLVGRQNAVFRFFDIVHSLPTDCTLFMQLQEDSDWIESSNDFLLRFKSVVNSWLGTGHQMEVIYWMDQHPDRLQQMIHSWLPMHLDSLVTAWYSPFYGKDSFPVTLLLVPGHLALIGLQSGDEPDDYHTILYTDQSTILQFNWMFHEIRKNCKPLIENFDINRIAALISLFSENWHDTANKTINVYSKLPLMLCLPTDALRMIFDLNQVDNAKCEEMINHCVAFKQNREAGGRLRLIHSLGAIEQALKLPTFIDPFLSALAGQSITIDQAFFRQYILGLSCDVLEDENVEIALARSETFNRSAWPNLLIVSSAFLTAWGNTFSQNRIFTQEATLVHAFDQYFMDRWNQIPRVSRDRHVVSKLLSELARPLDS